MGEKEVNETIMPMNVIKRYKCSRESKDSTKTNYKRNVALASCLSLGLKSSITQGSTEGKAFQQPEQQVQRSCGKSFFSIVGELIPTENALSDLTSHFSQGQSKASTLLHAKDRC